MDGEVNLPQTLANLDYRCKKCGRMKSWNKRHRCDATAKHLHTPAVEARRVASRYANNVPSYYLRDTGCKWHEACLSCPEQRCRYG